MILALLFWITKILLVCPLFTKEFGKKGLYFICLFILSEALFLIFLIEYLKTFLVVQIIVEG